jgi:hypothetical protein
MKFYCDAMTTTQNALVTALYDLKVPSRWIDFIILHDPSAPPHPVPSVAGISAYNKHSQNDGGSDFGNWLRRIGVEHVHSEVESIYVFIAK